MTILFSRLISPSLSIGALGSEALQIHVVAIHVVFEQLGEIPA